MKKNKNLIIFDFDGVLADSFDTLYLLIRDMMVKVGIELSENSYRDLFMDNVHKGFKKIIGNTEKYKIFKKLRDINYDKYYRKYGPKLFPGASKILKKLDKNYIITVASSGKKSNIVGLLKKNKVHKHFDLILATNEHSKESMIREILKKHGNSLKTTIMITDTVGDIKIAKKLGLKTVAVTWGFHSPELLRTAGSNHIIKNFRELQRMLK